MDNSVSKIAVYVTSQATAPATVEMAGQIASSFDASLTGIHVMTDASVVALAPAPGVAMSPALVDEIRRQDEERAATAEGHFRAATEKHGWPGDWLCVNGSEGTPASLHLADFVVAGQAAPDIEANADEVVLGDLVLEAGRPIIVHPHAWSGPAGETHVVVGWKPGREAVRAVHDALPFLRRVSKVTVVTATSEDEPAEGGEGPATTLCRYLRDHGVSAAPKTLLGVADRDAGEALVAEAMDVHADLLVLGGFSHSRLREGLFGGVTRHVIEHTTVPALLSH